MFEIIIIALGILIAVLLWINNVNTRNIFVRLTQIHSKL